MKRRFIALLDFSEHSEVLLKFSYNWALQAGAELLLVHYITRPLPTLGDRETLDKVKHNAIEQTLSKLKNFAEATVGNDVSIKYHADVYNVSSAIIDLQRPGTIDYIFVGMNDKSALENLIMASTAVKLANRVDSIVIALPTADTNYNFSSMHIAIKQPYPLGEARFEELLSIAPGKIGQVNFFSVLEPGADRSKAMHYLEDICTRYKRLVPSSCQVIEAEHTTDAIKEHMQKNKGVLVVQKGPRNFVDIFRKFFTTEIINHAQIPVIILP